MLFRSKLYLMGQFKNLIIFNQIRVARSCCYAAADDSKGTLLLGFDPKGVAAIARANWKVQNMTT